MCAKTLLNEPAYFWVEPQDFLLLPCLELNLRKSAPSFTLLLLLLPLRLPRKNMSALPVNAPSPPVVTLLATLAFIPESATTNAPSPVVRPVAPARTISSNSESLVVVSKSVSLTRFFSYRIHLSPGSRRNSRRPGGAKRAAAAERSIDRPPPTLEDVSVYAHHLTPPDSPVPLVQPIIPVDGPTPPPLPSTPEQAYYGLADSPYVSYSYRSATTTYQEQGQGSGFTYIHTTPLTSASHDGSRRSISHIMSYPASPLSSSASSNPASSHGSGPPTPTYIYDEAHTRYNTATTFDHSNHQIYSADGRFQSPPPILAPIDDRRDHFLPAYLYRSCPHPIV